MFKTSRFTFVILNLDNIKVCSKNKEEHAEHPEVVLGEIKAAGLTLNKKKYNLFRIKTKILRDFVCNGKVTAYLERFKRVRPFPRPQLVKEMLYLF